MKKLLLIAFVLVATACNAADSIVIKLWHDGAPESNGLSGPERQLYGGRVDNVTDPELIVYPGFYPNGKAVIACPGGGYIRLAMRHEGTDMAQWFNRRGITYAVLKYRMPNGHSDVPLADAMQAMRIMRSHAAEWGVTSVGIMGASAGGHLASTLATHYTPDTRPDFQILLYPVINMSSHKGSTMSLLGKNPADSLIHKFDNDQHVDSLTPPAFIVLSADDKTVGTAGAISYFNALNDNGVPATLHIYPEGGHGWGFNNSFPWKHDWTTELSDWLARLGGKRGGRQDDVAKMSWRRVSSSMPDSFYATDEAQQIADRVVYYQQPSGGWAKNVNYHFAYTPEQMRQMKETLGGATIDNNSTTQELRFLARVYSHKPEKRWRSAFIRGVEYLLDAQYPNGGWPQFWPKKNIDGGLDYSTHITFNDNAMVNVMNMLKSIYRGDSLFQPLRLDKKLTARCRSAFYKGVDCILKCQIRVDGKPTVWCAQHDETTLAPAPARAYELESFSGGESADIVLLLMGIDNPSDSVVNAVDGAVDFFKTHEIRNIRTEHFIDRNGNDDTRIVPDAGHVMWARFYDLDTQEPFFCGRDGVKHKSVYDIERERRAGYGWYTDAPSRVLARYPKWLQRIKDN